MGEVAFAAPILPGKLEAWNEFHKELTGSRHDDFAAANKRHGVDRQRVWHQQTPMGDFAVVHLQGSNAEGMMPSMGASDDPFDIWFRGKVNELHGIDMTQPPPTPPPELEFGM